MTHNDPHTKQFQKVNILYSYVIKTANDFPFWLILGNSG